MYASSAGVTRGCDSGLPYSGHQNSSHRNPIAPVAMNAHSQPQVSVIHGTTIGVTSAPTLVPALKIPVAVARSRLGNHSATILIEPGKFPASPSPSANRAAMKPAADAL